MGRGTRPPPGRPTPDSPRTNYLEQETGNRSQDETSRLLFCKMFNSLFSYFIVTNWVTVSIGSGNQVALRDTELWVPTAPLLTNCVTEAVAQTLRDSFFSFVN